MNGLIDSGLHIVANERAVEVSLNVLQRWHNPAAPCVHANNDRRVIVYHFACEGVRGKSNRVGGFND